ncbi:hypothetical protein NDU88_006999 [Pleurodeles waltl]|uniref:Uncharacterized protein n=1 Tax=Pleurodeles waltl TaxID=8319 RepID=A0AAV7NRZ4_PLEWA|nr:hypothetical protein NDU88_006999 [Pleurodeles waltl]
MFILGCPGHSKSRRRHPGVPGQQPPALRLCVPQGVYPKRTPHRPVPGGPSSPRLLSARSPAARRHQAPPPSRRPIRHRQVPPPDAPVCTPPPSGWARIRIWRWPQCAAQSMIAAAIWLRFRGSRSAPGRTSTLEAASGVAAVLERPRPYQPLTFTAAPKRGAPPQSPRPQRSSHSSLSARPPASEHPGTNLKSAPAEPNS